MSRDTLSLNTGFTRRLHVLNEASALLHLGLPLALILDPSEPANAGAFKLAVAVLAVGGLFQVADTVHV